MLFRSIQCAHKVNIVLFFFFFFNDTATTEIYTLSLHDALPIYALEPVKHQRGNLQKHGIMFSHKELIYFPVGFGIITPVIEDNLHHSPYNDKIIVLFLMVMPSLDNSRSEEHTSELQSHSFISYAVFCLKKKKK